MWRIIKEQGYVKYINIEVFHAFKLQKNLSEKFIFPLDDKGVIFIESQAFLTVIFGISRLFIWVLTTDTVYFSNGCVIRCVNICLLRVQSLAYVILLKM